MFVHDTRPNLLLNDKSLRLVPKDGVDSRWLVEALSMRHVRRQVSSLATGTKDSMRNISQANLLSVQVPAASAEQQAVALARCDTIAAEAQRLSASIAAVERRGVALRQSGSSYLRWGWATRRGRWWGEVGVEVLRIRSDQATCSSKDLDRERLYVVFPGVR